MRTGGDFVQWNEALISGSHPGLRGDAWDDLSVSLLSSFQGYIVPTVEDVAFGSASPLFGNHAPDRWQWLVWIDLSAT